MPPKVVGGKPKKPWSWKADLEIGTDIRIPTTGYNAVRRENKNIWKRCLKSDASDSQCFISDELKAETTIVRNNDDQEVVEPENLIDAFKYGSKLFTISEVERSAKKFESGPKSLILIGFVKRNEIPVTYLIGDGYMMFQPVEDSDYSVMALSSLVEAMVREQMVAIVRRVFQNNGAPKIGALIPEDRIDEDEGRSLVYIELPFSEDVRNYTFSPLWNTAKDISNKSVDKNPTQAQLKAVDNLIDSMMLVSEGNDEEDDNCLNTEVIPNPFSLYLDQCITSRTLNPRQKSIPSPTEGIKQIMEVPDNIVLSSSEPLAEISDLFKLEIVAPKEKKKANQIIQKNDPK